MAEENNLPSILVVDDDIHVATLCQEVLAIEGGFDVTVVHSADQALATLRTTPIDLVFSDIVMEGEKTGLALAKTVHESFPSVAMVLTTGYSKDLLDAGRETRVRVLEKPWSPMTLIEVIKSELRLHRAT